MNQLTLIAYIYRWENRVDNDIILINKRINEKVRRRIIMEMNLIKNSEVKKEKRDILSDGIYLGKLIDCYVEDHYIKMDFTVQDDEESKMISIWINEKHNIWLNKKLMKYANEQQIRKIDSIDSILNKIYVPIKIEWKKENDKNNCYKKII